MVAPIISADVSMGVTLMGDGPSLLHALRTVHRSSIMKSKKEYFVRIKPSLYEMSLVLRNRLNKAYLYTEKK